MTAPNTNFRGSLWESSCSMQTDIHEEDDSRFRLLFIWKRLTMVIVIMKTTMMMMMMMTAAAAAIKTTAVWGWGTAFKFRETNTSHKMLI